MGSLARAGSEARGVSDSSRPPVGGRFRQPDRTPFFRLAPAFGFLLLRNNGYVPDDTDTDTDTEKLIKNFSFALSHARAI